MTIATDDIVGALYAGTLDGEAWNGAILRLTDLLGASGAILLAFNPATGAVLRHELHRIDPQAMRQYQGYYAAKDPRIAPGALFPVQQPMSEGHLLPMRELARSEIYTDFLRTFDIPHFLATWLHKAPDRLVALTFHGSHRRGPFEREETERLVPLLPHLSRALEIRDRLETQRFRAEALVATADRLTFGVLVLDAMGRILDANVMAQKLLGEHQAIWRTTDGTLCLAGPPGQLFRQWIRDGAPARGAVDGMLHVLRPDGRLPVGVLPTPVSGPMIGWISSAPRWLILLFDPEHRVLPAAEVVARDLGITGREAEVAAQLSLGLSLRQVSERLGVSIHTARAQLKSIYAKTGMNSQAQIVRRLVTGPGAHSDATSSAADSVRGAVGRSGQLGE